MINERVLKALENSKVQYQIEEFAEPFKSTKDASELLGVEMSRLAKCLAFRLPIGIAVLVLAGDALIDKKKYQKIFKVPMHPLDEEDLMEYTGFIPGAVTPIAISYRKAKVFMDVSLRPYLNQMVYPSGGTLNSAVGITAGNLFDLAGCKEWIDITLQYP